MKILYIAGKIRDVNQYRRLKNIEYARDIALEIIKMKDYMALAPHLYTFGMAGEIPEKDIMRKDLQVLKRCDGIFMIDNWKTSKGATRERKFAQENNIPIYYSLEELK